ncbi:MAG: NgoFVII family restriction endonuclease [Bacilli bacterium]|nr:NgoFVII family restriction endonuclease [Bacilli bacterium]
MFIESQKEEFISDYSDLLQTIGALSNLFSESNTPYLDYRVVENIFCKSFKATNLARFDCSADAKKDKTGIGIKTFLHNNGNTLQKVAEFNEYSSQLRELNIEEQVKAVSNLRNERINVTKRIHNLDSMIYHLVTRTNSKFFISETNMDTIDINKINNIKLTSKNVVRFFDDKNEYSFNMSKSTLYERFKISNINMELNVKIIDDPYEFLRYAMIKEAGILRFNPIKPKEHVFLPLFSVNKTANEKYVPEKSGLNQWNASGRVRDNNEIYIPIRAKFYEKHNGFFPARDVDFELKLPNGEIISAKICQDGGKALMSNPNKVLGKWLLRDVMNLKEGEVLTYEKLKQLGLDSVVVYKEDDRKYSIDFARSGSYDEFIEE